ncbi:MAG TPA: response regulator [Nitrobacter sp.]|nr:response regulator [Nitrobacter sp.]
MSSRAGMSQITEGIDWTLYRRRFLTVDMPRHLPDNSIDQTDTGFLIEKNADGIIVVDEDGVVLFANPAAEQLFARGAEELVGSPIGIPFLAGETTEITVHQPNGNPIATEIRAVATTWNHRPARMASLRDISVRKAMDERLRHSAKMEAVGQLTAGIAHDFNNLLTVVLGNIESAQRRIGIADPGLARALENALHGARRAAVLTERLLTFARRKPLEPKVFDPNVLVSGMSDLLQRTLGETIRVETVLAASIWSVDVDPTELEAALLNLAVNARDAMPSGGTLTIETSNVELDFAYAAVNIEATAGPYVLLSITDTGSGMAPDALKRAFEPFFTTKPGGQGTGLGLSQVYGFVAQSGGHAKLYSEPGIGTTVRIYLPKAQQGQTVERPQGATVADEAEAPRSRPGETILVVEDDDNVRSYTVGSLRELGYAVLEANDATSALEILGRESRIDLLFTDLGLPGGIDGRVLTEHARDLRPALKILVTTAYAGAALIHDGRLDPGVELLNKPFSFTALAARVRKILDRDNRQEPARLLIVEDEVLLRMFVVDALTEAGCRTEEAGSFAEAMTKIQDVGELLGGAIIDLGLPDKPGNELAVEIRKMRPDLPIILATGFADERTHQQFSSDSHVQILTKPFEPAKLIATLRDLGIQVGKSG